MITFWCSSTNMVYEAYFQEKRVHHGWKRIFRSSFSRFYVLNLQHQRYQKFKQSTFWTEKNEQLKELLKEFGYAANSDPLEVIREILNNKSRHKKLLSFLYKRKFELAAGSVASVFVWMGVFNELKQFVTNINDLRNYLKQLWPENPEVVEKMLSFICRNHELSIELMKEVPEFIGQFPFLFC